MRNKPTPEQISEKDEIVKFFSEYTGELVKGRFGVLNIVNPELMVRTGLDRLQNAKGSDFNAALGRMKWYKDLINKNL